MARKRYECIGGPRCGEKFPMFPGVCQQAFGTLDDNGDPHFYRLCMIKNAAGMTAKFWHYIGQEPNPNVPPKLRPSSRMFR